MKTVPPHSSGVTEPEHVTGSSTAFKWSLAVIALLVGILVAAECATRLLVPRISRIERRIGNEYSQAITPVPVGAPPRVLVIGNSLLDAGIQFDRVRDAFAGQFEMRRFMVEQTDYFDWRYGFRRLFADGARPKVIVLMLSAGQLASNGSRGEYSAYRLTSHEDILNLSGDLQLHPTNTANMVFANFSMFYALRGEIRKVLLGRIMPDLPFLTKLLIVRRAPVIPEDQLRAIVHQRARILRDECERHGARFVLALPPEVGSDRAIVIVKAAAAQSGVEVLVPFRPEEYVPTDFAYGSHLNETAAAKYTAQLIQAMRESAPAWTAN